MSTTNILDLNNRIDELADSYPAAKVMLSDGVTSVGDALDAVMPRTASGSTLNQLVSAVNQLSTEQKNRCSIFINDNRTLTYTANGYFACIIVTGSPFLFSQYRFDPTDSGTYARYINGSTTPDTQAISKWVLYYQGTPIS